MLGVPTRFGLGFMLRQRRTSRSVPRHARFGHPGAGGSIAFADPEARLGFGYVMNQMQGGTTGDPRGFRLIGALYHSPAG